jgi:serine/threonine protein kinase
MEKLQEAQPDQRFTEAQTKKYFVQAALGISAIHDLGIVHRDIKPGNMFMSDNTPDAICKIGDFGTARELPKNEEFVAESRVEINQTVAGTGMFMSPEMK